MKRSFREKRSLGNDMLSVSKDKVYDMAVTLTTNRLIIVCSLTGFSTFLDAAVCAIQGVITGLPDDLILSSSVSRHANILDVYGAYIFLSWRWTKRKRRCHRCCISRG